jgi:hypothetical protein
MFLFPAVIETNEPTNESRDLLEKPGVAQIIKLSFIGAKDTSHYARDPIAEAY